jgi:hypothetical protein
MTATAMQRADELLGQMTLEEKAMPLYPCTMPTTPTFLRWEGSEQAAVLARLALLAHQSGAHSSVP